MVLEVTSPLQPEIIKLLEEMWLEIVIAEQILH